MASAASVLGVIRAARPVFRSANDRVAFAVHALLLAEGYSLTAVGTAAESSSSSSARSPSAEESEVGIEGWNELDGAYSFQYSGGNQPGLCKSLIVKCTAMGDSLMVEAAPSSDAETPANLEIKVADYAADSSASNYKDQYNNLTGLVEQVNSSIIKKLPASQASVASSNNSDPPPTTVQEEPYSELRQPRSSILEDPPRTPGFGPFAVPAYGESDLLPGPGAGMFGPRRDIGVGGGSMLVGPGDPRWGRVGVGGPQPGPNPPGVPPGARFDPFGPPGVPGFEPDRFTRNPRRPPGGTHPDLEHFSPF